LTTGSEYDNEGTYLTPESTKMSFKLNDFKYKSTNSSKASLLALKMYVVSSSAEANWKFTQGGNGRLPSVSSKTKKKTKSGGFFSWNGTYAGDGKYHDITSNVEIVTNTGDDFNIKKNEYAAKLLFTFSGGEHKSIYWGKP
jgi:hypothetical protein